VQNALSGAEKTFYDNSNNSFIHFSSQLQRCWDKKGCGISYKGIIPPGEFVAIKCDGKGRKFSLSHIPPINLTQKSEKVLAIVPEWLTLPLMIKLAQLSSKIQDSLSDIVLKLKNRRYIDEVAFSIAYLSKDEIEGDHFDPRILIENVELIYAADSLLDYVELIECGKPGLDKNFYTTTRYRLISEEGEEFYEIPPEVYYWYIVYPRIGREPVSYFDPVKGEFAPPESGGVFWRKYYLVEDDDLKRRASTHFIMEYPNLIGKKEIASCVTFACGYLKDFKIDPIPLIVDRKTKNPVLCVFSWPGGQFDGNVIATTIPVEKKYENGNKELLENLLVAGNASAMFSPVIVDSGISEIRFAILKDRDPFGKPTIENAMREMGFKFDVFKSSEIENFFNSQKEYLKIIIPSDQPLNFYKTLSEKRELFKEWMKRKPYASSSVIEFHGAVGSPEDDWSELRMPCDLTSLDQSDTIRTLEIAGYPTLLGVLRAAKYLWNCKPLTLSGKRALKRDACVLDRIGYFVTQNQQDRCAEMSFYYRGPDCEAKEIEDVEEYVQSLRSRFPQRSLYLHFGNCGEVMHDISAALKTALIPTRNIIANCIDHVWNECYVLGKWRTYTAFRSDGGTRFDDGVYKGRKLYGVMALRPDGYIFSVTPNYCDSLTKIHVKITDKEGFPVDGITATVKSEWNKGNPPPMIHTVVGWTDINGEVDFSLEGGRDYYLWIFKNDEDTVEIITGKDTIRCLKLMDKREKTDKISREIRINLHSKAIDVVKKAFPVEKNSFTLDIFIRVSKSILYEYSSYYKESFTMLGKAGKIDLYILDAQNYEKFLSNQPFSVIEMKENIDMLHQQFTLPNGVDWYILISNLRRNGYGEFLDARIVSHSER